jgi:hypothetical protein
MTTTITVCYRDYHAMDWTEDTFTPDAETETETVRRAVCALYQRNHPRPAGWSIGLWNRFQGGQTAHVQLAKRTTHRRGAVSLQPTIIVQWTVNEDDDA